MCEGWEMLSGKFAVVATMLQKLRQETTDRIVIVSNYTQTLDLFQTLCRTRNVSCFHRAFKACKKKILQCAQFCGNCTHLEYTVCCKKRPFLMTFIILAKIKYYAIVYDNKQF